MIWIAPTLETASIGIPDTLFLMLLALVVFGPRRLPEIGRQIGKLMYEFRKVSNDFKYQMEEELRASEEAERQQKLQATIAASAAASQVTLDVPPHPVPASLELGSGVESPAIEGQVIPAVDGEVRAEPTPSIMIQPPSTGEVIAGQRPFRATEAPTESGDAPTKIVEGPVVVEDEGRTGAEVQPGVEMNSTGTEREASHV